MRLLLDTHTFLWFVLNDAQLSSTARSLIVDPNNEVLLSPASYWEIAIKISIGKYSLPTTDFENFMQQQVRVNNFTILPISIAHAAAVIALPLHHRDPFDRLLAAQAMVEAIPLLSGDAVFDQYPISRIW